MDSSKFMNLIRYWWTFWIVGALALACAFAVPYLGYRTIGFVFLIGVLAVGFTTSRGPVLFAAALSALIWNFFFIPPRFTFAISEPEDLILCLCYFAAAVITGSLTSRAREHEALATEREARTMFLYEVLQDILQSSKPADFLSRISWRIEELLGGKLTIVSGEAELPDTNSNSHLFPIRGRGQQVGFMIFENKTGHLKTEHVTLLESVAQQVGLSLERLRLESRLRETERLEESERMHQTLLNSISHELRTPLTSLLGFAGALEDDTSAQSVENRKALVAGLGEACDRMNRVIENLLDMTRLNSGALGLRKEWHDVSDLFGVVLKGLRNNLKDRKVAVQVEESLPLVEMDFRLMEHALANVILNAATYAPLDSSIDITARREGHMLALAIDDQGPGIPEFALEKIFEKFYRIPGTPPGGTGLGLSIVKSIVEFHNGQITVSKSSRGAGARFVMRLPLGQPPILPAEARDE